MLYKYEEDYSYTTTMPVMPRHGMGTEGRQSLHLPLCAGERRVLRSLAGQWRTA